MISIPQYIILDLIPLYLSGDVSPETRDTIDAYLETDAALRAHVETARSNNFALPADEMTRAPAASLEIRSIQRTRNALAQQRWLFGLAFAFSAIGLGVTASLKNGRMSEIHPIILDYPIPFGLCLVIAALCWFRYWTLRHRSGRMS